MSSKDQLDWLHLRPCLVPCWCGASRTIWNCFCCWSWCISSPPRAAAAAILPRGKAGMNEMNDIYVSLFCTRLFLSLNDMCPEFGQSRTFFSSALSPFSDYRFDIRLLEFCRLLVLSSRHPVEILMNIFWKSFQFWTTEKNQEYRVSPVE